MASILNSSNSISYIAIEGAIGAGKTSLANLLSTRLNAKLILEKFDENPFLEKFYKEPETYSFRTQIFFLLERFQQLQELHQKELFQSYIISDYIFEKDRIFAYMNLNDDELRIYEQVAAALDKNIVIPDIVVYLQSSTSRLMQNIRKRDREIERDITEEYIDDLNEAYNYFFSRYKSTRVLIVNCEETDFVNENVEFENLMNEIFNNDLSAVKYYNPSLRKRAQ